MYRYIPKQEKTRAKRLACFLFAVSLLVFALSGIRDLPYRFAAQGVSFALITAAIMVAVRYLFRSYCYMIQENDGSVDLDVYELSRSGSVLVCRLSMASLKSITPLSAFKRSKGQRLYNYCADIKPKNAQVLEFENEGSEGSVVVMLGCDGEFLKLLEENPWKNWGLKFDSETSQEKGM